VVLLPELAMQFLQFGTSGAESCGSAARQLAVQFLQFGTSGAESCGSAAWQLAMQFLQARVMRTASVDGLICV
jgi:hypothetical protein